MHIWMYRSVFYIRYQRIQTNINTETKIYNVALTNHIHMCFEKPSSSFCLGKATIPTEFKPPPHAIVIFPRMIPFYFSHQPSVKAELNIWHMYA